MFGEPLSTILLASWLIVAFLAFAAVWIFQRFLSLETPAPGSAMVVVVIPVRGLPIGLPGLWQGLCSQTYPHWRLVFVVESTSDPAHGEIGRLVAAGGGPPTEIVVAGATIDTAQKIHNQLAALSRLESDDEVVVFADADVVPPPDWLVRVAGLLRNPEIVVVSGYRWLFPVDGRLSTALVCAVNSSIATLPRLESLTLAWGGTMALRKATLREIGIEKVWRGAVSDDLSITRALWRRGQSVWGSHALLLPSPVTLGWRSGFSFARRQYQLVRMYVPLHWWLAAVGTTLPLVGWAVAVPLAIKGVPLAWLVIVLANLLDQARASMRLRVVRALWGEKGVRQLRRVLWLDRFATPLCLLFHAIVIWSSAGGRTIAWADRVYLVKGRNRLDVVAAPGRASTD